MDIDNLPHEKTIGIVDTITFTFVDGKTMSVPYINRADIINFIEKFKPIDFKVHQYTGIM